MPCLGVFRRHLRSRYGDDYRREISCGRRGEYNRYAPGGAAMRRALQRSLTLMAALAEIRPSMTAEGGIL